MKIGKARDGRAELRRQSSIRFRQRPREQDATAAGQHILAAVEFVTDR